jgi:hypothetical protein
VRDVLPWGLLSLGVLVVTLDGVSEGVCLEVEEDGGRAWKAMMGSKRVSLDSLNRDVWTMDGLIGPLTLM